MSDIQPLQAVEARVLGVLVEKSLTTPESYPLSLNALVNGCNQKSNRQPVTHYDEQSVEAAVRDLRMNRLAHEVSSTGSRVVKFAHKATERLELDEPSVAVVAELLMRGPQTQGELRQRASRMSPIDSLDALHTILEALIARRIVARLAPLSGSRAKRYVQLLAPGLHGDEDADSSPASGGRPATPHAIESPGAAPSSAPPPRTVASAAAPVIDPDDFAALKRRIEILESQVDELTQRLGEKA